jgi:cell division protein FtsZ
MPSESPISETSVFPVAAVASGVRVKIIGIGGAGAGTLVRLGLDAFPSVRRAVVDTDERALSALSGPEKVQIGRSFLRGLGTEGDVSLALRAAEEDQLALEALVRNTDLVFILASMSGGTGGGVAPLVAKLATSAGATVIAFAFTPFAVSGGLQTERANKALPRLELECGAVITVSNDQLLQMSSESVTNAYAQADLWVGRGIGSLCSMLFNPGLIKLDFASLRSVIPLRDGKTLFSIGHGQGADAQERALDDLFTSPLLQRNVRTLSSLLVSIRGGPALSLSAVHQIVLRVTEKFGAHTDNKIGAGIEEAWGDSLEICVIGTVGGIPRRVAVEFLPALVDGAGETAGVPVVVGDGKKGACAQPELFPKELDLQGFSPDGVRTDPIEGQDVDVPAYIRRGIKITLSP